MNDRDQNEAITAAPAVVVRLDTPQVQGGPKRPAPSFVWFLLSVLFVVLVSGVAVFGAALLFVFEEVKLATTVLAAGGVVMSILVCWPLFSRSRGKWWRVLAPATIGIGSLAGWGVLALFVIGDFYVVPTGAMAPTILGFHRHVTCPQCGHVFPVNSSSEAEAAEMPMAVVGCSCPNCFFEVDFQREQTASPIAGGDRIAATKFKFGKGSPDLKPFQVMVFDHPPSVEEGRPRRFIFRVVGLPGQTLAIHYGDVLTCSSLTHADDEIAVAERWRAGHMHADDEKALQLFQEGTFAVLRKPPEMILALRHLVYDNDRQAKDLAGIVPPRWSGQAWSSNDDGRSFAHSGESKEIDWLRYRHILRPGDWPDRKLLNDDVLKALKQRAHRPQIITDYLGYNSIRLEHQHGGQLPSRPQWVGDLLLECQLSVLKPEGDFLLELAKGADRFRACWSLATGECCLSRVNAEGGSTELAKKQTRVNQAGDFRLHFANVDQRLVVWIDDELPFGDGVDYESPKAHGPTPHDLEPVSIGSQGAAVQVRGLQVWRDTHYTNGDPFPDDILGSEEIRSDPERWEALRNQKPRTFYVQPGHYFVLGDNSQASYDSRSWGVVPERMAVGRARLIYAPGARIGWIK